MPPALERARIHLVERDAAAGDLRLLVALIAGPREREGGRAPRRAPSAPARRSCAARRSSGTPASASSASASRGGRSRATISSDESARRVQLALPRPRVLLRSSATRIGRAIAAGQPAADRDMRHVEHRRSAVAAMREEKAARGGGDRRATSRAAARAGRCRRALVHGRIGDERGERGIGVVHGVSQLRGKGQPAPSLPVAGTDRPPVASTTASAAIAPRARPDRASRRRAARARSASRRSGSARPPAAPRAPGRRARRARGPTRETACPCSLRGRAACRPGARRTARCAASGHERSIAGARWAGESVTKRSGSSAEGRTLQRPPPLMRILRPPSRVRSRRRTSPPRSAAAIAATRPAAPAPTTTMGMDDEDA